MDRNKFAPGNQKSGFTEGPGADQNPRVGQNLPNTMGPPTVERGNRSLRSYGPEVLGLQRGTRQTGGPGEPPAGFVGGTTSVSEWYIFWALEKLLGPVGWKWVFQESRLGGRHRLGGAVVDFIIYIGTMSIGVRIVTYRFHHNVNPAQQARDREQFLALHGPNTIMIDVYEQDYIDDETGQAAIRLMLEVLNKRWRVNPLSTGYVVGTG